jgi:tetratricopeptide (TPR) repeat protein
MKPEFEGGWINLATTLRQNREPDKSIEVSKEVIRRFPRLSAGYTGLGNALLDKGLVDDAIAAYGEAVRREQNDPQARMRLGMALLSAGRVAESIEAFKTAASLQPQWAETHYYLGASLIELGRWNEAADACRNAIRAQKDHAEAHCNLAVVLLHSGRLRDALTEFKIGHQLSSRRPDWNYPSLQWVSDAERLVNLERRLTDIVTGKLKPADADERQLFARLCHYKRQYEAAARLYEEALDSAPRPANSGPNDNVYNVACSAAATGCGLGEDVGGTDDDRRARRRQALDWLRGELDSWTKVLNKDKVQARALVERMLQHWQADPDLTGVRDAAGLAKLPDAEREAWKAFWADVEALRKQAREPK